MTATLPPHPVHPVHPVHAAPPPPPPRPAPPLPYHRLAHATGTHRWWRPLAGTAVIVAGVVCAALAAFLAGEFAATVLDRPRGEDGFRVWGGIGETAVALLSLALALPVVLGAARWTQRRPAGTVSATTGRLRWGWLGRCLALALPVSATTLVVTLFLPDPGTGGEADARWAGWSAFLLGLAVVCALVPFQAAAEEYVFRGWLVQAVGAWCRSPWLAVVPQALLFAAAHGWGTPWGFVDLAVFGLVGGLLTIRTGGLEAAIALHVLNNLLAFGVSAAIAGALASDETAADMGWSQAAVDSVLICGYAAAVLWLARRRGVVAAR